MNSCKVLYPITQEACKTTIAGVQKLAVVNWSEDHEFTSSDDCVVDTITLADDEKFLLIDAQDETAYATDVLTVGSSNSSKYINQQVGGITPKPECNTIKDWNAWLLGRFIFAVLTKDGEVQLYGVENGLTATNFDYATGTALGDSTGVTFLFEGAQPSVHKVAASWKLIEQLM